MENAMTIAAVMGPAYLVLGLSVLFYANSWQKIIKEWTNNHYYLFSVGLLYLILGLLIINLYNVWVWNVWLIVTVSGWLLLVKSVLYWLVPGDWTKNCMKSCNNVNWLYFWALVTIVAGAALSYYVYLV